MQLHFCGYIYAFMQLHLCISAAAFIHLILQLNVCISEAAFQHCCIYAFLQFCNAGLLHCIYAFAVMQLCISAVLHFCNYVFMLYFCSSAVLHCAFAALGFCNKESTWRAIAGTRNRNIREMQDRRNYVSIPGLPSGPDSFLGEKKLEEPKKADAGAAGEKQGAKPEEKAGATLLRCIHVFCTSACRQVCVCIS
jgi:hypothetical protein